jgi:UPF0176 protein
MSWKVCAFYRFVAVENVTEHVEAVKTLCTDHKIFGTILIAPEGVNSTIAGSPADMDIVIAALDERFGITQGELKYSHATHRPFKRLKVRAKKEIITMAAPEADPTKIVGTYIEPSDWNELLKDPEIVLLDTRNDYEVETGTFKNAIDPKIETFTGFKDYVQKSLDPKQHKKIAMFCTGGIRCEKASAYMLAHGFEEVYHLKGGILKYLEVIPTEESTWEGTCFVFDERREIAHGLVEARLKTSPQD